MLNKSIDDYQFSPFAPTLSRIPPAAQNTFTQGLGSQTVVATPTSFGSLNPKRINSTIAVFATDPISPNIETMDIVEFITTLTGGTLTVSNPIGKPQNGQTIIIKVKSSNAQTYAWGTLYRGSSTLSLPSATTGSSKWDYLGFVYNEQDGYFDLLAYTAGF